MMRLKVTLFVCLILNSLIAVLYSDDRELLMFVHTHIKPLDDEDGLNVAYQALTAIMQKAAPILMTENIWQHVVQRKDRFASGLQYEKSLHQLVMNVHHDTNTMIKDHQNDISFVNQALNYAWYRQHYRALSELDQQSLKYLMFEYFCYYVFNYLSKWNVYRLAEGYLLFIPQNQSNKGFCLQGKSVIDSKELARSIFQSDSSDLASVLKKYLCKNSLISWSFYLTGHGFHQEDDYAQAGVAGLSLQQFHQLLLCLDTHCLTKFFVYSSCYGAGQHAIVPYQIDGQDLLLSYPIILISLTDAPAYVFGLPSGLKLPPYDAQYFLVKNDVGDKGLKTHLLQKFRSFCKQLKSGTNDISLVRFLNPNIQCDYKSCNIIKIENVPLIRKAYSPYFLPLDQSGLSCIIKSNGKQIDLDDKKACLFYVNQYFGTIVISKNIPVFVSMIPGRQVHYIKSLQASDFDFASLIQSLFLSIDDLHEQNIYLFDNITCSVLLPQVFPEVVHKIEQVLVLTAGQWLPSFAREDASCYVYAYYKNGVYAIVFGHNKEIQTVYKLNSAQKKILQQFKQFLLQENEYGHGVALKVLLSSSHYKKLSDIQKNLLNQCQRQEACK